MPQFILLILFPLLEILVMVQIADEIGVMATLGLLILAGVAGVMLLRLQGTAILNAARSSMSRHEIPAQSLFRNLGIALAALLLILPGFLSDALALFLLIPQGRLILQQLMTRYGLRHGYTQQAAPPGDIEGDFTRIDAERLRDGAVEQGNDRP